MATLPPLADVSALAGWLGESSLSTRAGAVLSAASVLVRSYCGQDFTDAAAPDPVAQVTVQVAGRLYTTAPGAPAYTQENTGPFGFSQRFSNEGPYLTKAEKQILAPYRTGAVPSGLSTLATTRGEPGFDDRYLQVEGGAAIPFLPEDRTL
ncbi:MAG TPA: hypothetical protein VFJ19_17395 [Nocardioidaceae bacterium]|nr:hypothetical protein [Nocardioidaceae bacterium]